MHPLLSSPGSWARSPTTNILSRGKAVPTWQLKQALCGPCLPIGYCHGASRELAEGAQVALELRRWCLAQVTASSLMVGGGEV